MVPEYLREDIDEVDPDLKEDSSSGHQQRIRRGYQRSMGLGMGKRGKAFKDVQQIMRESNENGHGSSSSSS